MSIPTHSARAFADAMQALLPPGQAWQWPQGGTGDSLMLAMGQELARLSAASPAVVARAVTLHVPGLSDFTLPAYRTAAQAEAVRQGAGAADVQVDHLTFKPFQVGSVVGDQVWSPGARYIMRVRYRVGVVGLPALRAALDAFKQAHVALWFEPL
jgi:hypothetical protein